MLLRSFVENGGRLPHKVQLGKLSECDVHFFAGILHLFPSISYCHLHIVVPAEAAAPGAAEEIWGNPNEGEGVSPNVVQVSNQSPFPPPFTAASSVSKSIQHHLELAKKLFETCPISTQLRLSIAPLVQGVEDLLAEGDKHVLTPLG